MKINSIKKYTLILIRKYEPQLEIGELVYKKYSYLYFQQLFI